MWKILEKIFAEADKSEENFLHCRPVQKRLKKKKRKEKKKKRLTRN